MQLMTLPKALIFDMDGLMLESERLYQQAWKIAASELGYELDAALYLSLVGRSNAEAEQAFVKVFGTGFPTAAFNAGWHAHWHTLIQSEGVSLKPGLLQLLDWTEQQAIPKAVGTSSNFAEADLCLSAAGIRGRFSTVVTVDQVAAGKPEPDIFLEAANRLNIDPGQCLVLEDSNAGVQAAQSAGIPVMMVPDLQVPTEASKAIALAVLPSLHEVGAWLQQVG
ncbi:MAG: HAD family phosphatase [Leptolyngbya sp. SIO1D8]|nr:HAD family phosphatase [Leptolyngbya sp. SIO1D8]